MANIMFDNRALAVELEEGILLITKATNINLFLHHNQNIETRILFS